MKILVLGANGQLGSDLMKTMTNPNWEVVPVTREKLNAETFTEADWNLLEGADYVVNTVSYHKVDECEDQVAKTLKVNVEFVTELAKQCAQRNTVLFHFSTDYIFDGTSDRPYTETDTPNGLNIYGISKAAGEMAVRAYHDRHFIFRVSSLFGFMGASGKGGNFVETMIRLAKEGKPLKVIEDQMMAPTHTLDIARAVNYFVEKEVQQWGTYNCCNSNKCSWYEFTKTIFEMSNIKADLGPTDYASYKTKAKRPKYSVLDNSKLNRLYEMPDWKTALAEYLKLKGHAQ